FCCVICWSCRASDRCCCVACCCWACASFCASALRRCASLWDCSAFALCAVSRACESANAFCFCVTSCCSCSAFCCSCSACFCASAAFCRACWACVWLLVDSLIFWLLEEPVAHPSARAGIVASHHIRRMLESSKVSGPSPHERWDPCVPPAPGEPADGLSRTRPMRCGTSVTTSSRRRGMHALRSLVLGRRPGGRGPGRWQEGLAGRDEAIASAARRPRAGGVREHGRGVPLVPPPVRHP